MIFCFCQIYNKVHNLAYFSNKNKILHIYDNVAEMERDGEGWRSGEMEGGRERGMGRGPTQLFLRVNGQEETIEVAYSWGYTRHTNFSCMPKWDDCEKVFVKLFGKVCSFVASLNNNNALRTRSHLSHTGCFDAPQNCAWLFFDFAFCRQCRLWGLSRLFNSMYGLVRECVFI